MGRRALRSGDLVRPSKAYGADILLWDNTAVWSERHPPNEPSVARMNMGIYVCGRRVPLSTPSSTQQPPRTILLAWVLCTGVDFGGWCPVKYLERVE